jgi:hypothetical protein
LRFAWSEQYRSSTHLLGYKRLISTSLRPVFFAAVTGSFAGNHVSYVALLIGSMLVGASEIMSWPYGSSPWLKYKFSLTNHGVICPPPAAAVVTGMFSALKITLKKSLVPPHPAVQARIDLPVVRCWGGNDCSFNDS